MSIKKDIPAWLPNWKDASQYPDPEDTSYQQWAWEFLRRNQVYQEDQKYYEAQYQYCWGPLHDRLKSGTLKGNEFDDVYGELINLEDKYGIARLPSPDINHLSGPYAWDIRKVIWKPHTVWKEGKKEEIDNIFYHELTPTQFGVVLDRARPKLPQMKAIEGYFEWGKKPKWKGSKPQCDYFRNYLRILDAKQCDATHINIAIELFPAKVKNMGKDGARNHVSKNFKMAKSLRDGGYLDLVFVKG